jgi:lipopolysaccharide transport system permease protein
MGTPGQSLEWLWLGIVTALSLIVMQLGYAWFMKTKRGFADVI